MMIKKITHAVLTSCLIGTLLIHNTVFAQNCKAPAAGCSNTDFSNSFLNSNNPNTIEYDNIVSVFHGTLARQANGTVLVWGAMMTSDGVGHVLTPQPLNSSNYPGMSGEVLKFTAGSIGLDWEQHIVLTTNGLYAWGNPGYLISTAIKSDPVFGSVTIGGNTTGLPAGVAPGDVKMLFGTSRTLVITTCDGFVWVLSQSGTKNGDGTGDSGTNPTVWHKVKTNAIGNPDLTDVVAVRGSMNALMALKSDGTIWTWGEKCYLGDGTTSNTAFTYATQMQIPAGVTPKMIGMLSRSNFATSNTNPKSTYYILTTDGRLFALGNNESLQLGDFTSVTERSSWSQVKKSSSPGDFLTDVAWISPMEHDSPWFLPCINILTSTGYVYSWGYNNHLMLGLPTTNVAYNPTIHPGGLSAADKIMAVETGGHTSIVVKQCTGQYGYVGHRINGSMGNGSVVDGTEVTYNFTETAVLDLCAAPAVANIITDESSNVCPSGSFTVAANSGGGVFSVTTGNAGINAVTGSLTVTGEGPVGVTYSSGVPACPTTDNIVLQQRDFGNLNPVTYPIASATTLAINKAWLGNTAANSDCATAINDGADGLKIYSGASAVSGEGALADPFLIKGSQTYNFRLTVNGNGAAKPVYWGMWYDVNGNGNFTDSEDIFQTGNILHGSPVTINFNVNIPVTGTASGATDGAIRVVATAVNTSFTKAMNGTAAVINGEVEDFYVKYYFSLPVTLTNFDAIQQNNKTLLQWSTTSEQNNKGFDVLRSSDANTWIKIGYVNSHAAGGNSSTKNDYQFTDYYPLNEHNYYRLRQTDHDGNYEYSYIRQVNFNTGHAINIYPNPAGEKVTINGLSGTETIRIVDLTGRIVKTIKATNGNNVLHLGKLAKGMYHVNIITTDGRVIVQKMVKTK